MVALLEILGAEGNYFFIGVAAKGCPWFVMIKYSLLLISKI